MGKTNKGSLKKEVFCKTGMYIDEWRMGKMKRIIIYGAGDYCTSVMSVLAKDYDIIGVVDKDRKKQGTQIAGKYRVFAVDEMHHMDYDGIVVSVKNHYGDIREELKGKHIPENKIKHYSEMYSVIEPFNMINGDYDIEKNKKTYSIFQNSSFYEKVYGVSKDRLKGKWISPFWCRCPSVRAVDTGICIESFIT